MSDEESATRQCPFCKEDVRADALRCKHCQANIPSTTPGHDGVCPYCKEDIKPDATRCRWCHANFGGGGQPCCPDCAPSMTRRQAQRPGARVKRVARGVARGQTGQASQQAVFRAASACEGCSDFDVDDQGIWCFLDCGQIYCFYELCQPTPIPIDEHPF